jgi:hypothetical protein
MTHHVLVKFKPPHMIKNEGLIFRTQKIHFQPCFYLKALNKNSQDVNKLISSIKLGFNMLKSK